MAKINLLPWRDELRIKRNNEFVAICAGALFLGLAAAGSTWFYYDQKLQDQEQANQLVVSTNQNLDVQLKALDGLQDQRNAIVERMKLIQGLQTQRPIAVHLIDEIVRITPSNMYITKFQRTGDKFTIEGKAESPNTVAELLRNLEASTWYRNAFMNAFLVAEEPKDKAPSSVIPRVEESYGSFTVTVDLDQIAEPILKEGQTLATTTAEASS
ncbi:PilN domain-containing protein [Acinetobacter variabilis]|uniref:PilN domain-containing protein n=1 Tax=Acinetobacter variabilis TaxID=70346 RepID=UPI003A88F1B4